MLDEYYNKILVGECSKVMGTFPDNCIDLTVTSPPYDDMREYKGYIFDYNAVIDQLYRVTKDGGVVVWVVGDKIVNGGRTLTSFRQALAFQEIGFSIHDVMIFHKRQTPFMRSNAYTNCYEFMFVIRKGDKLNSFNPLTEPTKANSDDKYMMAQFNKGADGVNNYRRVKLNRNKTKTNVWQYNIGFCGTANDDFAFKHPAIFPDKLAKDHILSWTNKGDVVLDPMAGSGTTLKMARLNGRRYIGIEMSKEYAKIAAKRVRM